MGISFSCPFSDSNDLEDGAESIIVKSISFGDEELQTMVRSISFNNRDSDPTIMKSLGSGKMIVEGSISFKRRELETMISVNAPSKDEMDYEFPKSDSFREKFPTSPVLDSGDSKHTAALRLQKVYKSFRTRRKLADCAVLVELEQSWWNLLDSAELKHSSVSFFDIEKQETAISRWSRARTRAAKVGKGLSKNDKARKLALQHWLEAIDPRHRYGHNLHFYYLNWLHCQSREPFFYWLDIGDGKEVNLVEKCPRIKLQQQCIKYLGPMERKAYEVVVVDGKFLYKQTGEVLDTRGVPKDAKSIFVLSASMTLYVGQKKKGTFQHSSFLAGGATSAAGRLEVENGTLKAVWPHSGHYQPTKENFQDFISFLEEHNVNLAGVKMTPVDEEDALVTERKSTFSLRSNSSEEDLTKSMNGSEMEDQINVEKFGPLTNLEIPDGRELFKRLQSESLSVVAGEAFPSEDHRESKRSFFDEDKERNEKEESVIHNQLGKKLSRTWTSGAGPRISCVRDYPSELQFRALEQVNLSPRSGGAFRPDFPTMEKIGSPLCVEKTSMAQTSMWEFRTQPSPLRRGTSVAADFSQS